MEISATMEWPFSGSVLMRALKRSCLTIQRATSTCSIVRFYVASQRVVPGLYVFVSLVFVLTASATSTSQHNTPQQVGVSINDSTTINYTI